MSNCWSWLQILVKFRDYASLAAWEASDVRTTMIDKLDALVCIMCAVYLVFLHTSGLRFDAQLLKSHGYFVQALDEPEMEYVTGVPLIHTLFNVYGPFRRNRASTGDPPKWKGSFMVVFAFFLRYLGTPDGLAFLIVFCTCADSDVWCFVLRYDAQYHLGW
jgi:hypothetical protein